MNFPNKMRKTFKKYFIPQAENDHKPFFLREKSIAAVTALVIVLFFAAIFGNYAVKNNRYLASIQSAFLVDLANVDRTDAGLSKLAINEKLISAANLKASDMSAKSYFAHVSPDGRTPWYWIEQAGYSYVYAGENLAVNFSSSEEVEKAWMNSPTHKANILHNKFTEVGIATATGTYKGNKTTFVVQMFGSPKKVPAPKPATVSANIENISDSTIIETEKVVTAPTPAPQTEVLGEEIQISPEQNISNTDEESFMTFVNPEASPEELTQNEIQNNSNTPKYTNWFERMIVSPSKVVHDLYIAIAAVVIFALLLKIFIEIRLQHPRNIAYGILLLVVIGVCMYINSSLLTDPILVVGVF